MPKLIKDLGIKYPTINSKKKARFAVYECDYCGNQYESYCMRPKKSCGCYNSHTTHGYFGSKLYTKYEGMMARCSDKTNARYGMRGISICDEWVNNKESFFKWAMNNGYRDGLILDRINPNGNYEPSNCRFVDASTSSQNTRLIVARNKSGYRGVVFSKKANKWQASIHHNGKEQWLGYHTDKMDAVRAYDDYVIKHGTSHPINIAR